MTAAVYFLSGTVPSIPPKLHIVNTFLNIYTPKSCHIPRGILDNLHNPGGFGRETVRLTPGFPAKGGRNIHFALHMRIIIHLCKYASRQAQFPPFSAPHYGYCANFFQKSSRKALTNRTFPHTLSFGPDAGFPPGMRDCPAARIFHCLF